MEKCRICNIEKNREALPVTLDYLASESLTYKNYFEKFTSINYSNDKNLPQKICTSCQAEINLFIIKADTWLKNEKTHLRKRKLSELPPKEAAAVELQVNKQPKLMKPKSAFEDVRKLFDLYEKDPLKEVEKFSHIQVHMSQLEKDGEISHKWLQEYVHTKKVWTEMVFKCSCKTEVSSLIGYLNHFRTHSKALEIKCPELNCKDTFNGLSSFINHIVTFHQLEYLCYCCISCGKIFYNIPSLIRHYEVKHPEVKNLFMCVECGSYCPDLKHLKAHKNLHYPVNEVPKYEIQTPVPSQNNELLLETDISLSMVNKPKRGRRPKNNNNLTLPGPSIGVRSFLNLNKTDRIYHQKTGLFDETSNRIIFPCTFEGCSRILVTQRGYEYHMMVHNNIRPFECQYCGKSYRTKQVLNSHVLKFHTQSNDS